MVLLSLVCQCIKISTRLRNIVVALFSSFFFHICNFKDSILTLGKIRDERLSDPLRPKKTRKRFLAQFSWYL